MPELTHDLVPKHEILAAPDKQALLERYRVQPEQLPKIKATDPQAKALGAKPGDILRVTRKSPTAGEAVYYRLVINA